METAIDKPSPVVLGRRYELLEPLGAGGMGTVFRANDRLTGHMVALKQVAVPAGQLLFAGRAEGDSFELALAREFRTLASIRHPHVISVYDFGFGPQRRPYYTMEYLAGGRTILDNGQALSRQEKAGLIVQMLQALVYLHRRGILHRDLKPGNALVLDGRLRLLDFGIAVITERTGQHLTQTTAGTVAYLAPEIFQGAPYSRASDLYAVGVIAFQLFTGHFPYNESNLAALLYEIVSQPIDAAAHGVDGRLAPVLNRLLSKSQAERYTDAAEVMADLTSAVSLPRPLESVEIRESFLQAARFVGRNKELADLAQHLEAAKAGAGNVVLIGGESGVGKSRLVEELRIRVLAEGTLVLRGYAIREGGAPFRLWRDVFRLLSLMVDAEEEERAILQGALAEGDSIPEGRPLRPLAAPPQVDQAQLAQVVAEMLGRLAQPALIILEDLHWAGSESIALLQGVAQAVARLPTLLLATYRDDRPLSFLQDVRPAELLPVRRLSQGGIVALSAAVLGKAGRDPDLIRMLERETEGNALFLVEAVRSLAEMSGRLADIGHSALPARIEAGGIRAVLERRLARAPDEARSLLEVAAVAGRTPDLALLKRLEPTADMERLLSVCAELAILEPDGVGWRFSHDRLRDVLLSGLADEHLQGLHRRLAAAIERAYPDEPAMLAALAYHWDGAGDGEKALRHTGRAGHQAVRSSAYPEAVAFFKRALSLLAARPEAPDRARQELSLLMGLGPALIATHGYAADEVGQSYGRARELATRTEQSNLLFNAIWGQWTHYNHRADHRREEELLKQLLALARASGDEGLLLEAYHSGWGTHCRQGNVGEAEAYIRQGLALYAPAVAQKHIRMVGHDPGVCAHSVGSWILWLLGYPDQALDRARAGLRLAQQLGHAYSTAIMLWGLHVLLRLRGDSREANEIGAQQMAISEEHGFAWVATLAASLRTLDERGADGALMERQAETAERLLGTKGFMLWPWALSLILQRCLERGEYEAGLAAAERQLEQHTLSGQVVFDADVRRLYGELLLAEGGDGEQAAASELNLALAIAREKGAKSLELRAVMSLTRLEMGQGKAEQAKDRLAEILNWFTEGFDTVDLVAARQLLNKLQ